MNCKPRKNDYMSKLGLYVHIPFCQKKCKYCDFVSFSCEASIINNYFNALEKEIENTIIKDRKISTIYIGGGTPSLCDSKYIVKTLELIKEKFIVHESAEITIEINPGTVNEEKLIDYKIAGVNRISIGLQSTIDRLLKLIGRIHSYEDFLNTYNLARKIGFKNINVDLMFALPTQTKEDLIESLNNIISLKPNHISLYSLILEENTELESLVKDGKMELPGEELERKMYHLAKKILEQNGYNHYEISNFAKMGLESKHNIDCWNQEEYLGFGLSAHSYFNNKRYSNISNLDDYIKNINNGEFEKNVEVHEIQTEESRMKEYMMLRI